MQKGLIRYKDQTDVKTKKTLVREREQTKGATKGFGTLSLTKGRQLS